MASVCWETQEGRVGRHVMAPASAPGPAHSCAWRNEAERRMVARTEGKAGEGEEAGREGGRKADCGFL